MKGLARIPNNKDLRKAYNLLQSRELKLKEADLILWTQWSRFDPRLAEIIISRLVEDWPKQSPTALNLAALQMPWPAVLGVLLEHAKLLVKKKESFSLFENWMRCSLTGIGRASGELFFIGIEEFAGKRVRHHTSHALRVFKKWGYLCDTILLPKFLPNFSKTYLPKRSRLVLLKDLLKNKRRIAISDYLRALSGMVSRRQAERDLKEIKSLKSIGRTRARTYWMGSSSP